jgi:hypothetical protein
VAKHYLIKSITLFPCVPLAQESLRRLLDYAETLVVIGDGAHWIWNLAQHYWPQAIHIVDWYHATEYIWAVAHALYPHQTNEARQWAQTRCTELWEGQVDRVIEQFYPWKDSLPQAAKAHTYFVNNRGRMQYHEYRAAGLQIGSSSIESNCKLLLLALIPVLLLRCQLVVAPLLLHLFANLIKD